MTAKPLLVLLCVLASPAVFGAQLIKDINTFTELKGSAAQDRVQPVDLASGKLLVMNDGVHGDELWITDGTPAGTRMVRDIWPGADSPYIQQFVLMGGIAYFWANDGVNGAELWRSDGTTAGTRIVVNIGAGPTGAGSHNLPGRALVVAGGVLYFAASDAMGLELWRSNGTADGTYRVRDIYTGDSGSDIQQLIVSGSRVFFGATDGQGFEPWVSDGTEAGTVRVANVRPGAEGSGAWFRAATGGVVFFTADNGLSGSELWRVNEDGSNAAMVADINAAAGSNPQGVFVVGNRVVFTAVSGTPSSDTNNLYSAGATGGVTLLAAAPVGAAPDYIITVGSRASFYLSENGNSTRPYWVTDGTAAGTAQLNIQTGLGFFNSHEASAQGNGEAFFNAPDNFGGAPDIWRTDGTVAGTRLFLDRQNISGLGGGFLVYFNGRVYFPSYAPFPDDSGVELWSTDGSPAGTSLVLDINPGTNSSNPTPIGVAGGKLLFFAADGITGYEPWTTDGTAPGTVLLGNFSPEIATRSSHPMLLGEVGAEILFSADNEANGRELWASDGTAAGTRLIKDIAPGTFGSNITNAYPLGNVLLFGADDVTSGLEIWRSDGTPAGTFCVSDIHPGGNGSLPSGGYLKAVTMNGHLYFVGSTLDEYRELWRTDGTAAGTAMVADINPGANFDDLQIIGATTSRVLLLRLPAGQSEGTVWSTDGTAAGTFQVANNVFVNSPQSALFNGRVCFPARETGSSEIYCSNGSPGDMVRVTDLASIGAQASGLPHAVNGTLLVPGFVTGVGQSVFATNGTPASTHVFSAGSIMNLPDAQFGGGIVYQLYDNGSPILTFTDGTIAGTRPFLPAGVTVAATNRPFAFEGNIIFVAADPQAGPVLWRSDGTSAGTRYLVDIDPGTDGSAPPADFLAHAGKLFFAGTRMGVGRELWALTPLDPNASDDVLRTAYGTAATAPVLANDADFDGTLNPSTVEIVTPPVSGTATVDNITGAINFTPAAGFSGTDLIAYRVADNNGRLSNLAYLSIVVASPAGTGAGTAPAPTPTPTPTPPSNPPKSGGGGALGVEVLLLALLMLPRRRGIRRSRASR